MVNHKKLAIQIDRAIDAGDVNRLGKAIQKLDSLLDSEAAASNEPILHYYRANAFSGLRVARPDFEIAQFSWQQPELTEEILSLRRAARSPNFARLNKIRRCQILTNLGNALNSVGRPIEAIAAWDRALSIESRFAMAAANRAHGLLNYGAGLYDGGHQCVLASWAADGFRSALDPKAVWDGIYPSTVKANWRSKLQEVEAFLDASCDLKDFDPDAHRLTGDANDTDGLEWWRLKNHLFLNPLNDLGAWPIAAQDVFHLPDHSYSFDEEPRFVRFFDLVKQEYAAACVLLYEGISSQDSVHPADEASLIFDHLDYSVSSISIEKQKVAFRMAYSILDKCAVFINDYFALGHDPKSPATSFRKIWFERGSGNKTLNRKLPQRNWRLRGLYAISLDLFDDDMKEISSPLAVQASAVRNAAEHRFVSVYDGSKPKRLPDLCETITAKELIELAIHVLQLARATIMGLSLAVHLQETHFKPERTGKIDIPIFGVPRAL